MTLHGRLKAPVPLFFRRVQTAGLVVLLAGLAVLIGPARVPVEAEVMAANLVTAGFVAAAVSQLATGGKQNKPKRHGRSSKRR